MFASELGVLFRRRRTWAMLCALAAIPILIAVAVRVSSAVPAGRGPAFLDRISQNGLFVGVTAMLVSVPLFLPLTVGVVAGDTVAGEAGLGTLRYLLVAPAGRVRLLLVKYAGAVVFAVAAPLVVALVGAAVGAALFPVGPVTLLSGDAVGAAEGGQAVEEVALDLHLGHVQVGQADADQLRRQIDQAEQRALIRRGDKSDRA